MSFDVPFPPDYGGAIDVYYRIKALHSLGVEITLHCFEYGRGMPDELKKITHQVYYYRRRKSFFSWLDKLPFIVKTRSTKHLIRRLLENNSPILFEGLHSTYFLEDERLKNRLKMVRTHNIEHEYYSQLAERSSGYKKTFYKSEAKKLRQYEAILKSADVILAIQENEAEHFKKYCSRTFVLPASTFNMVYHGFDHTKPYFLYHGNLSVNENEEGAKWLIKEVFAPLEWCHKLLIAGKNPSQSLISFCKSHGVMLTANPDDLEMRTILELARVHVFYSTQNTGIKLKLLNALHSNGHVIANPKMLEGSELNEVCLMAKDARDYQSLIQDKIQVELSPIDIEKRASFLMEKYSTEANCSRIILPLLQSS